MGLDIGFEKSGRFRLPGCLESEPSFCETIRANRDAGRIGHSTVPIVQKDIQGVLLSSSLSDAAFAPTGWTYS
jgi:DNA (cytosine-5)-methyltransferase 1